MLTLSDLFKVRERLVSLPLSETDARDTALLSEISKISDSLKDLDTAKIMKVLKESVDLKSSALRQFQQAQIGRVDNEIKKAHWRYQQASREWCNSIEHYDDDQYKDLLLGYYPNDEESISYCKGMIQSLGSWTDAGLLYQMNDFDLDDFRVFYPLYIVDRLKDDLVKRLSSVVSPSDMRKIRIYGPNESYDCLPKEAIGMIISRNHFTHTNKFFYEIELRLLASLLAPGGILTFNFNDVETSEGALLLESKMRSYQTKSNLNEHLQSLGLEIVNWTRMHKARTTWVHAKKPGIKKSCKKGEMIGRIVKK